MNFAAGCGAVVAHYKPKNKSNATNQRPRAPLQQFWFALGIASIYLGSEFKNVDAVLWKNHLYQDQSSR